MKQSFAEAASDLQSDYQRGTSMSRAGELCTSGCAQYHLHLESHSSGKVATCSILAEILCPTEPMETQLDLCSPLQQAMTLTQLTASRCGSMKMPNLPEEKQRMRRQDRRVRHTAQIAIGNRMLAITVQALGYLEEHKSKRESPQNLGELY